MTHIISQLRFYGSRVWCKDKFSTFVFVLCPPKRLQRMLKGQRIRKKGKGWQLVFNVLFLGIHSPCRKLIWKFRSTSGVQNFFLSFFVQICSSKKIWGFSTLFFCFWKTFWIKHWKIAPQKRNCFFEKFWIFLFLEFFNFLPKIFSKLPICTKRLKKDLVYPYVDRIILWERFFYVSSRSRRGIRFSVLFNVTPTMSFHFVRGGDFFY